jgi:hypothetical protein
MATLNASKTGRAYVFSKPTHAAARDATTANGVAVDPTYATSAATEYRRQAGRSGNVYAIYRTFYYFDTSGITGNVTDSSLNILGSHTETATVIVVPSTAFGGDGSADIVVGDYDNITFDTSYGAAFSAWDDGLNNELEFRNKDNVEGAANASIRDNDYFICAVIEYAYDYSDTDPGSTTTVSSGINFATAAYLDYTEAASGYANDVMGVATGNIGKVLGVATANISKVIGV